MGWTQPGPGRPPGSKDSPDAPRRAARLAKIEAASTFARLVVEDEGYRKSLLDRAKRGVLPPQVEVALFYYAYGKPVERVEVEDKTPPVDPSKLSAAELEQRALRLAGAIAAARRRDEAAAAGEASVPVVPVTEPKQKM